MIKDKRSLLAILIGSFIISVGINNFFVPFHILDGGMIGLGLIAHYQFGWSIGGAILVLSIPIYVFAWFFYRDFFYNSIIGFIISALFIDLFHQLILPITISPIIGAIIGGALLGVGVGIMFLFDISTGALDLLGQMIATVGKINVGIVIFFIDFLVIFAGTPIISKEEIILSTIAVAATGVTTTIIVMMKQSLQNNPT